MLNISEQLYVGWDSTSKKLDGLFEAEVIPYVKTFAKTLTRFVNKYDALTEYDNVPLPGFTLYKVNKKHWGSKEGTWLVIDPRGFLIRISSDNLSDIITATGITEGLIQDKCVWIRDDLKSSMRLVPISSNLYTVAVDNSILLNNKVKMIDVNIGDTVLLQNKLQGTYMGTFTLFHSIQQVRKNECSPITFVKRQVVQVAPNSYFYKRDTKILKVLKNASSRITLEDSLKNISSTMDVNLFSSSNYFSSNNRNYYDSITHLSTASSGVISIELVEIPKNELEYMLSSKNISISGSVVLEQATGDKFLLDPYYRFSIAPYINGVSTLGLMAISSIGINTINLVDSATRYVDFLSINNFVKFYKIMKKTKYETFF